MDGPAGWLGERVRRLLLEESPLAPIHVLTCLGALEVIASLGRWGVVPHAVAACGMVLLDVAMVGIILREGIPVLRRLSRSLRFGASAKNRRQTERPFYLAVLSCFAFLCNGANRENVELAAADLKRDVRALRAQRVGNWWTRCIILVRVLQIIGPIAVDGLARAAKKLLSLRSLWRMFTS